MANHNKKQAGRIDEPTDPRDVLEMLDIETVASVVAAAKPTPVVPVVETRETEQVRLAAKLKGLEHQRQALFLDIDRLKQEIYLTDKAAANLQSEFNQKFPPLTEIEKFRAVTSRAMEERKRAVEQQRSAPHVRISALDAALGARHRMFSGQRPAAPRSKK